MRTSANILFCIIVLALTACGGGSFEKRLSALDSVLKDKPDSVYELLLGMEEETMAQNKSNRMYYELLRADAQNKAYVDFTTDSVMRIVADYYDRHGSANEQMRAHYLLGCTYRDLKDVPMELQCFQEAVEKADTTKKDCEWGRMASIYGQMANIYHYQYLPEEELKALSKCEHYSIKIHDDYGSIKAYELRMRAYLIMNMPDTVLDITNKSRELYKEIGCQKEAARLLGPAIEIFIDRERFTEAEELMNIFEKESEIHYNKGEIEHNTIIYYYYKGQMALYHNNIDSARYCFTRLLEYEKEAAYKGFLSLYEKIGNADSIAKYAKLYAAANDSSFLDNNAQTIAQMTAMYNYGHQKHIAELHEREAKNANLRLSLYASISILAFLLIIFLAIKFKYTKEREIIEMTNSYYDILSQKESLEKEIDTLTSSQKDSISQNKEILKQKEQEILALQHMVNHYSGKLDLDDLDKRLNAFRNTEIFTRIKQSIRFKGDENKLTDHEWERYDHLYEQYFPKYHKYIITNSLLNHDEKRVGLLLIFGFTPKELSYILDKTMPRISNIRASINKKIFNADSATTLDKNIKKLF